MMSEFINKASQRKDKIKNALKRIHEGEAYEDVKQEFAEVLSTETAQDRDPGTDVVVRADTRELDQR